MMMTFSLSTWYVQVKMQDSCRIINSNVNTKETLTPDALTDAVEKFLGENNVPVLIKNGGMCPIDTRNTGGAKC